MAGDAITTPFRKTHLRCDLTSPIKTENARTITRTKHEMAALGLDNSNSSNVEQLSTGAIKIKPYHAVINQIHEQTPASVQNTALVDTDWDLAPFVTMKPIWRTPADLPGIFALNADVAPSGDFFFQKSPNATENWAGNDLIDDRMAYGNPSGTNFQMERHAVSKQPTNDNAEIYVRFDLPGTGLHTPDVVKIIYFGSAVDQAGHGQFALIFEADGLVRLVDKVGYVNSGPIPLVNSELVDVWRFAPQHRTSSLAIYMRIIPHMEINGGGYISFVQETNALGNGGLLQYVAPTAEQTSTHVYTVKKQTFVVSGNLVQEVSGPQPAGTAITIVPRDDIHKGALIRVDQRADLRTRWQIGVAKHPTEGYFYDTYIDVPLCTVSTDFTLTWQGVYPTSDCTIVGVVFDGITNMELTQTGSGDGWATFTPNEGTFHYQVLFYFTGDTDNTPFLWSYSLTRAAAVTTDSPGEFVIPDDFDQTRLTQYSITGPEQDMSHETATTTIKDPANEMTVLKNRTVIQAQLETEYDPADATLRSVLIRGEMTRTDATLIGGDNGGVLYPSSEWCQFVSQWNGIWARLARAQTQDRILLAPDPDTPNGDPFKVTDIVRSLLENELGADMVDIPDNPIRFSPAKDGGSDDLQIAPATATLETCVKFLQEYLGWFLIFDQNAGTTGTLRALPPSIPIYGSGGTSYKNLANFTLDRAAGMVYRPESYGTMQTNWTGTDATNVVAPIRRRTYKTWVKPMSANAVIVTATGEIVPSADGTWQLSQWAVNSKSFNPFVDSGGAVVQTQDRTDADFLGYLWPLIVVRFDLWTQDQVDRMTRRYYDQTCHSIKMCSFEAPLVLVTDTTDTLQTNPRPLRYYDPVTITQGGVQSQWLVRNCNIDVRKDDHQRMILELQKPFVSGTIGQPA